MRLWTVHPRYLDARGLVALWREALLAQKVLAGGTQGYTRHPQLTRFRAQKRPLEAMAAFLSRIADEADRRGYRFDRRKISGRSFRGQIKETRGQLVFEWEHLLAKLRRRAPEAYRRLHPLKRPEPHPLFRIVPGGKRDWEKVD
jgi:hypothetical protein